MMGMSNKRNGATLEEIRQLAVARQEAWERAHNLSMELYEAIESSGISPTKIAESAPISRVAIYSLRTQMRARIERERRKSTKTE